MISGKYLPRGSRGIMAKAPERTLANRGFLLDPPPFSKGLPCADRGKSSNGSRKTWHDALPLRHVKSSRRPPLTLFPREKPFQGHFRAKERAFRGERPLVMPWTKPHGAAQRDFSRYRERAFSHSPQSATRLYRRWVEVSLFTAAAPGNALFVSIARFLAVSVFYRENCASFPARFQFGCPSCPVPSYRQ
jgi:hypothetical protein